MWLNMEYFIITYGCQMNRSDSERIASNLEKKGFCASKDLENADIIIVNVCSVRQSSVDRIFGLADKLKSLREKNTGLTTFLTGCIVEKDKARFKKIFDHILNIDALNDWILKFDGASALEPSKHSNHEPAIALANKKKFTVGIPISTGCDNFCSYCVVPYTRGGLIPRDWRDILAEVNTAVLNNAKEIWLLGQNVNNYRFKGPNDSECIDFAKLIEMVDALPGEFWIRFTSPHPKDFDDAAIKAVATSRKVTPYFNLPVQSGDDAILKAMARPYTSSQYLDLVEKIRKAFRTHRTGIESTVALSTDVIVGFPGETEDNFLNTAKLFKKVGFDMAYIACYSRREGTAAAALPDNVPKVEKDRRYRELTRIMMETSLENNSKYVGQILPVLIDKILEKNGTWAVGKTRSYKTVKFPLKPDSQFLAGDIAMVSITKALPLGLTAQPL